MRIATLPLLLEAIVLAALGCSAHEIDKARFTENLCGEGGLRSPLAGWKPAPGIDAIEMRTTGFGGPPKVIASFGTLCAKAASPPDCLAAADKVDDPNVGWFPTGSGDATFGRRYLVVSRGDYIEPMFTVAATKKAIGAVDSPSEAAFIATEGTPIRLECGSSAAINGDGTFDILTRTGSGCGESDDVILHVLHVTSAGEVSETDSELLKAGDPNCAVGRRPVGLLRPEQERARDLGSFFAEMARLEAAAVPAFERMVGELRLHGAPEALVRAAERAVLDEIRHARAITALARRFGREPRAIEITSSRLRALEDVAIDNAREGCVRETFGALVATHQARAASDPEIAKVMETVARDETRHAQLSWAVDDWARSQLDRAACARVEEARSMAIARLREDLATAVCDEARELAGYPSVERSQALLDRLEPTLRAA